MELKGPHGPHPSFPLGVSLTSLSRQTSRETVGGGEEEVVCCWSYFLQSGWGSGRSFRGWAVPVVQSHWHCLPEGQVFLWLVRGGKDRWLVLEDRRDAGA